MYNSYHLEIRSRHKVFASIGWNRWFQMARSESLPWWSKYPGSLEIQFPVQWFHRMLCSPSHTASVHEWLEWQQEQGKLVIYGLTSSWPPCLLVVSAKLAKNAYQEVSRARTTSDQITGADQVSNNTVNMQCSY